MGRGFNFLITAFGIQNPQLFGNFSLAQIAGFTVAAGIFAYVNSNQTAMEFFSEVHGELKKVSWPTQKETSLSTVVVIVLVCITAVLLWGLDIFWSWMMRQII